MAPFWAWTIGHLHNWAWPNIKCNTYECPLVGKAHRRRPSPPDAALTPSPPTSRAAARCLCDRLIRGV
ncbi:hypothetical protein MLD38_028212 [Melastoma candidum]|uniref:Uncharacterized protein n=1 Tax=Melastoma candidum TaxID=119954 RepID=A0ACB9N050_9MYRT|nr:hypothetical protein MLD38_028212 [Melastoma candidum]